MKPYKVIDDVAIADIAFEVYGENLNELFEHAALAIFEETADIATIKPKETKEIHLHSESLDTLLFDYLSELLYIKDAFQFICSASEVDVSKEKGKFNLTATLHGEKINHSRHKLKSDIKAITYHLFKIEQVGEGWKAFIVVDI